MDFKDLFKTYEPPPGGLEALRIKLAGKEKERRKKSFFLRPAYWASASAAVVIVLIAIIFFIQIFMQSLLPGEAWVEKDTFNRLVAQSDDPSLIRYGLVNVPKEPVTVPKKSQRRLAVLKVPVESEDVIFYWVSSLPVDEELDEEMNEDRDGNNGR